MGFAWQRKYSGVPSGSRATDGGAGSGVVFHTAVAAGVLYPGASPMGSAASQAMDVGKGLAEYKQSQAGLRPPCLSLSGWREKEEKTCGLTENDMEKTTKLTEKQTKQNQREGGRKGQTTGTTCERGGQESRSVLWTD